MLDYSEPISTPLGQSSIIKLEKGDNWHVQTPKGLICSKNKNTLEVEFDSEDINFRAFENFIENIRIKNKEWKDKIDIKLKHKERKQNLRMFECNINNNTEYFDKNKNICNNDLIHGQCVILIITTPRVWLSKKNYGNTWEIKQIMKI